MSAIRFFSPFLISGLLAFGSAPSVEAGWWNLFTGRPDAPETVEQRAREAGDVGIQPGRRAPEFALSRLGGGTLRLSSYRGERAVILNFWATWCVPCREEMPSLEALSRAYGDDGPVVLGVNVDSDGPESGHAAAFIQETGVTFPVAFDPEGRASRQYAVHGLPVTYLIDGGGRIVNRVFGGRDWMSPASRALVERLLRVSAPPRKPPE